MDLFTYILQLDEKRHEKIHILEKSMCNGVKIILVFNEYLTMSLIFADEIHPFLLFLSCSDMFENGSYLRRRKRFKSMKTIESKCSLDKKSISNHSFLIDNLLAHDTSTNISSVSSSSSSNNPTQQFYDVDLIRQLTAQQQIFWSN